MRIVFRRAALSVATVVAWSCGSPTGVERGPIGSGVAAIAVDPASSTLTVGAERPLNAIVTDASGTLLGDTPVTWTVRDAAIATVSSTGVVTARGVGSTQVAANASGKSGIAVITVVQTPVASVSVQPGRVDLVTGAQARIAALTYDAARNILAGRAVTWASSNAAVATVDATGLVTAVAAGSATITATSEGQTSAATIAVSNAPIVVGSVVLQPAALALTSGSTATLTPTVRDGNGAALTGRPVTWSTSNAQVASVTSEGVVRARAPGTATITATSEGKSGTALVTVSDAPVATVAVVPATASITRGQSATLTTTITDATGVVVSDRAVTWTSSNTAVATVSSTGVVSALAAGTAVITAVSEGKSGSATVTVTSVPVGSVSVAPGAVNLLVGRTASVTATVRAADGAVLTDRPVAWSSSNAQVASVSNTGVVTAVAPGTANVIATSEGRTATAVVSVAAVPVGSVVVTPPSSTLNPGGSGPLTVTVRNTDGAVVTDRAVAWMSSSPSVATVSSTGVVTATGLGTTTISATSEGVTGSATLTVAPVAVRNVSVSPSAPSLTTGGSVALSATVTGENGLVLTDRPVTWTSTNASVATVSTSGIVTAVAPGSATISATSEGKVGTSTVTVVRAPVKSVTLQPTSASVPSGQTTRLTATVTDANDAVVTDRLVTWTTSNAQVATVSTDGVVTGVASGSATITATSEGQSGSAAVTVTATPVGSVAIVPSTVSLSVGSTATLSPEVRDANGVLVTDRAVTWTSSNSAVATVSPAGVVNAVSAGTAVITAVSEGRSGNANVTVTAPAPVATVAVAPSSSNLTPGQATTLTATLRDADGNVLTGRLVTWSSSNPGAATVSSSGLVTAVDAGTTTIAATSEGRNGTATVTVTVPVATVTLDPPTLTIAPKQTASLTATTRSASGAVLTGRVITYSSSNETVATVSADGRVTGVNSGTATIVATSEGKSATSTVTVQPGRATTVTVSPELVFVREGTTVQLTAAAADAFGNRISGRAFTWTSSDNSVATVSPTGFVTTKKAGDVTITARMDDGSDSALIRITN